MRYPNGKAKAVTFSYDDGNTEDIRLCEIFNKYHLKATFNLNSAWLGAKRSRHRMNIEQVQQYILDAGHEVAVHGAEHKANGNVRTIEGIRDVLDCRLGLEKAFGRIIRGMAYPDSGITRFHNGTTYEDIKTYLKQLDIVYSRTLGQINSTLELPQDWYAWMPTAHHDNQEVMDLIDKFLAFDMEKAYLPHTTPKLFYLWGHSYEFEMNNNWERMEEICSRLGGHDNIWYATNIEIYEYVEAYNSLVYSADCSRVYNPTLIDVYFEVDRVPYCVRSGETIIIE